MPLSLTKINHKTFLINSLFSFIPISFIAGNLILNVNILLFIIFTIFFYRKDIFVLNFNNIDKLILIFFIYTIFTGILNSFYFKSENLPDNFLILIKTISYIRYLLFYFAIRILIHKNILNFKQFFISSSLCCYFVCLDLIYQLNFGKDIFGYRLLDPRRLSGPFGENEAVAGSYLQRFSLFSFFLIPFFFKKKNKTYLYLALFLSLILIITGLIISGNRMPFVLFVILIITVLCFYKTMRKFLWSFILCFIIIGIISSNLFTNINSHYHSFMSRTIEIYEFVSTVIIKEKKIKYLESSQYLENRGDITEWYKYSIIVNGKVIPLKNNYIKEFNSGYQTWLEHKYIGGGIKSFRYNCVTFNCNTHPHNYYLEILSDLGLIGFSLLIILFLNVIYKSIFKEYIRKTNFNYNQAIIPFMFLFFIEIFPIKSTGSFFTTGNATYFFLIMSVTIALSYASKKKI